MTLIDILSKWAGLSGPELIAFLERAAVDYPDAAPKIQEWIAALNQGLSPASIMGLSAVLLTEGQHVLQGQFYGTQKSQDLS